MLSPRALALSLFLSASTLPAQRVELATIATSPELATHTLVRVRRALIGAGVGVLAGVFVGAVIVDAFEGSANDAVELSGFFLPYTIPAGAVAGAVFPGHRWVRVTLTQR